MLNSFSSILVLLGASSLAYAALQNNARDFEELKPPVVFQDGFFALEKSKDDSWRWMGDSLPRGEGPVPLKGTVLLLNPKKDAVLTIAAAIPRLPAPPTIRFFFNGERLDEFTETKDRFERSYKVPAAKQGKEEYAELLLTTDQFFIPMELNKASKDPRRLGLRVTKLTWAASEGIAPPVEPARPEPAGPVEAKPSSSSNRGWLVPFLLLAMVLFLLVLVFAVYQARQARGVGQVEAEESELAGAATSPDALTFRCSHCTKTIKARAELEGKKVKCPHCQQPVLAARPHQSSSPQA